MEKSLITKAGVLNYLQGAKEIEKDIYTLEKACEKLEADIENKEYKRKSESEEIKRWNRTISSCVNDISNVAKNVEILPTDFKTDCRVSDVTSKYTFGECFGVITFISAVLGVIIIVVGCGIAGGMESIITYTGAGMFGGCWLIGLIGAPICIVRSKVKRAEERNAENRALNSKNKRANEKAIQQYKEDRHATIATCKAYIKECEEKIKNYESSMQFNRAQVADLKSILESLYANREKFYSVGVVPPDYRTMDCVYVLDQIFRNDLADTMREAVLLYDERAFRGDVIRGMQNVSRQLGNLSLIMSALRVDVNMVGHDVALMCDDMTRVYEQNRKLAADVARSNDRLCEETKLHRYAVEALRDSNQKLVDRLNENQ